MKPNFMLIRRARWITVFLLWGILLSGAFLLMEHGDYGGGDFALYYNAARNYLPSSMPYLTVTGQLEGSLNYPPFLPQLLIPFAKTLSLTDANRVWFVFNVICLVVLLCILAQFLPQPHRFNFWLLSGCFLPIYDSLRFGQINVLLLVLIGLAWTLVRKNRPRVAGILLAIAVWIKLYPGLLLLYFLWKRDWRVVQGGIIGGAFIACFQVAVSGIAIFGDLYRSLVVLAGQGEQKLMWQNNSIFGFTSRLFEANDRVIPLVENHSMYILTRFGLTVLVIVVLALLTKRNTHDIPAKCRHERFDIEYALAVLTTLMISPWLYPDTLTSGLLIFYLLWQHNFTNLRRYLVLLAGIGILATYGTMCAPDQVCHALSLSTGFYVLVVLWLINLTYFWSGRSVRPHTELTFH